MACNVASLNFKDQAGTPVAAPSGYLKLYAQAGVLYVRDDDGNIALLGPLGPALASIRALEDIPADRIIYTNGTNQFNESPITLLARTLLDDASQGAMQTTLGLVIGTDVQAHSADLDSFVANASWSGSTLVLAGGLTATSITATAGFVSNSNAQFDAEVNVDFDFHCLQVIHADGGTITLAGLTGPSISTGSGVPAAVAPEGSLYLRTGGANGELYVRQAAAWVLK